MAFELLTGLGIDDYVLPTLFSRIVSGLVVDFDDRLLLIALASM